MTFVDQAKVDRLEYAVQRLGSAAVAFSGGADSTLLLAVCLKVLGSEHVLAVTADSPTLPRSELAEAQALARELGAQHLVIATHEMRDARYVSNSPDRCYYCKQELFNDMRQAAIGRGYQHLVYGATADDLGDVRPGMQAAREAEAVAPLLEAGFSKRDVRGLSRQMNLRTWDKPSSACLSSRFAYGTALTLEGLTRVERAEDYLRRQLGFRQVRVRDQGTAARIEVEVDALARLIQNPERSQIVGAFKAFGYTYVTVNLEGFRSGSLNDVLQVANKVATGTATEEC
ncbi:MAG: ATP-dependent sacrificial sulfur transferase LarE [Chloroflexi bacterium]|nr:ATP-dependent sacrificial sulfur transferase LarE [Chloroflexota bacterium]